MTKYRFKPTEVEAVRYDGTQEIPGCESRTDFRGAPFLVVNNAHGSTNARVGDWIILVGGEPHHFEEALFHKFFEEVR